MPVERWCPVIPRVGKHYTLKATVETECQEHRFTFPAGTVVRLCDVFDRDRYEIRYFDTEDGTESVYERVGTDRSYSFETVPQGYGLNLVSDAVAPATPAEIAAARPTVVMVPPGARAGRFRERA